MKQLVTSKRSIYFLMTFLVHIPTALTPQFQKVLTPSFRRTDPLEKS